MLCYCCFCYVVCCFVFVLLLLFVCIGLLFDSACCVSIGCLLDVDVIVFVSMLDGWVDLVLLFICLWHGFGRVLIVILIWMFVICGGLM